MSRAQAILLGLLVFGLGGIGYGIFAASGYEGFSAGIASSVLLVLVVVGWTATYLLRVVTGKMTYMEQRRTYRQAYDAHTIEQLQAKFDSLSPEEQEKLLAEVGQLQADADM
ncbi:DUF3007 family protein [Synechococcus sp. CS-1328]|uniref:DUF3007 family protein n=1 Tax=Synechococcus sp. CS-1328 TaxID=2847976 RepID=UPI00223AC6B6|nr:DUF3007 family protein [Synechococcus sp. CS-1328]MCT0226587.1 DUF3007 family protein [Synechococcus sp. CS-1328]